MTNPWEPADVAAVETGILTIRTAISKPANRPETSALKAVTGE